MVRWSRRDIYSDNHFIDRIEKDMITINRKTHIYTHKHTQIII